MKQGYQHASVIEECVFHVPVSWSTLVSFDKEITICFENLAVAASEWPPFQNH